MSETEIDDYIADLLQNNPNLSVDNFKIMFAEALSRNATLKEISKFQSASSTNITHSFRPNPIYRTITSKTPSGIKYSLSDIECQFPTLFMNMPINAGVYRWTTQILYDVHSPFSGFFFGGASSPSDQFKRCFLGHSGSGSFAFKFFRAEDKSLYSEFEGVKNSKTVPREETLVPDGSLVSLEVDMGTKTMSFFVENVKVPHTITNIPVPVHLGMTVCINDTAFISVSLKKLKAVTPSLVRCQLHEAEPVDKSDNFWKG